MKVFLLTPFNSSQQVVDVPKTIWTSDGKDSSWINLNLQTQLEKPLIGVGCGAHIVHNAVKSAADCLPFDIECITVKICSYFYICTVHVETLKEFCENAEVEYQKLLAYVKTRWLSLLRWGGQIHANC